MQLKSLFHNLSTTVRQPLRSVCILVRQNPCGWLLQEISAGLLFPYILSSCETNMQVSVHVLDPIKSGGSNKYTKMGGNGTVIGYVQLS